MICYKCKHGLNPADLQKVSGALYHKKCYEGNITVASSAPVAKLAPSSDNDEELLASAAKEPDEEEVDIILEMNTLDDEEENS